MPVIDFTVEAGKTFATLEGFAKSVGMGSIAIEHLATNFTKFNSKTGNLEASLSGITTTNQKLTASVIKTAKGVEVLNLKLQETPKAAAAANKAMVNALKISEAKSVRSHLQSTFQTSGLSREQVDAQRSRISQISNAVERGRVTQQNYLRAVAASTGKLGTDQLNETEQKVLNVIKRIENAQQRATDKARQLLAAQRATGTDERFGRATAFRLARQSGPQIDLLNPAAAERVRNQIDKIQGLFGKGLNKEGWLRALRAIENGTSAGLSRIENTARQRMARINIELEKGGGGGSWLNKMFGGGPGGGGGGGMFGAGGGNTKVITGLLVAQGVENAAEKLKAAATDTADFQKQIALLQTLTQDTTATFDQWAASIVRVSSAVGISKETIASAGYDLLSNQITKSVTDTETALMKASRFAVATKSNVTDSVNLLSSVINSFGMDISQTDEIFGKLFTTIDLGRVQASDLANTLGRPAVAAKSLGISFDELDAAMITISQTGLGVEQTNTLITNVFHKLLNPTKELQKHFDELGVGTGEMYAKQYGLVGILEDLLQVTGGSSAELSKFFNEIRGEQGIVQLTSRLNVFKDALKKLKENATYKGALGKFADLEGQRFTEEMQKYTNAFIGFKNIALKVLLDVTDHVGGLGAALKWTSGIVSLLGVTLSGMYAAHIFERMTGEVLTFGGALSRVLPLMKGLLPLAGAAVLGAEIGQTAAYAYDAYYETAHAGELLAEQGELNAAKQAEVMATFTAKMATSNEEALKKMQADALAYVARLKIALGNLASSQKEAFQSVAAELKNNFESIGQALKRVIVQGEERERALTESILKSRERLRDSRDKSRDDLYERQKAVNEVNVGLGRPDQEGKIQLQRMAKLRSEARKLADSGEEGSMERVTAIIDKMKGIAQERATKTRSIELPDGGTANVFKYNNRERLVQSVNREQIALEERGRKAQERARETQRKQNIVDRGEAKTLQDKADAVTGFKLFGEGGDLAFPSIGKAVEARDTAVKDYLAQLDKMLKSGSLTKEAVEGMTRTVNELSSAMNNQLKAFEKLSNAQLTTYNNQQSGIALGEQTTKQFAEQIAKIGDLKKARQEATVDEAKFREAALASIGTLEANAPRGVTGAVGKYIENLTSPTEFGDVRGVTAADLKNKIPEPIQNLIGLSKASIRQNDPATALKMADLAMSKAGELGVGEETFLDKEGKVTTLMNAIKKLRMEISVYQSAQEKGKETEFVSENQTAQAKNLVSTLGAFVDRYGDVKTAAEKFATVSEASFTRVSNQAEGLIIDLATMLKTMGNISDVSENMASVRAKINEGRSPSLVPEVKPTPVGSVGGRHEGGFINYFADGGFLQDFFKGKYANGSDQVPTMLSNGESVLNARATARFAPQIIAMNAGFNPSFATNQRSESSSYHFGDIHVHTKSGTSAAQTTRELGAAMKREIRRGSLNF